MTTTLLMLSSKGRTFRAEASISQAELPTMRECGEMAGYIVRAEPDKVGTPVSDLYREMWGDPIIVPAKCMPKGVAAFWLSRDERGAIDTRRCLSIKDAT